MVRFSRLVLAGIMTAGIALFAAIGSNDAQEKKPFEKHDSSALYHSLRDVINTGAKMFNEQGDHVGCYRLYHGSLLAVRPFLAPDLQKSIDKGIANAEKQSSFSDRAFELRKVLDEVRDKTKPADTKKVEEKKKDEKKVEEKKKDEKKVEEKKKDEKKVEEKKKEEKKVEEKKKDEKKVEEKKKEEKKVEEKKKEEKKVEEKKVEEKKVTEKKAEEKKISEKKVEEKKAEEKKTDDKKAAATSNTLGQLTGKVNFAGKSLPGGYFVTLVGEGNKKFSSAIQKDGSFQFKTPIPTGSYRVAVEPVPGETASVNVPARYRAEGTSGLSVQVGTGKNSVNLEIVN